MRVRAPRSLILTALVLVLTACANSVEDANNGGGSAAAYLELLAGDMGGEGNIDSTGPIARFNLPRGIATDRAGNIYVADGNRTIRKITPAGTVTTLAGTAGTMGSADGTGTAALFDFPNGVATDSIGNVYVADSSDHTIRKITSAGAVTTFAGTVNMPGSVDGIGTAASFRYPSGVATDSADNIYVADSNNLTIRKITPAGVVTTFAGVAGNQGSADGTGAAASFRFPSGVATDSADNVYVADTSNHIIRKITPAGVVTTFAGTAGTSGSANGAGTAASFNSPSGVTTDSAGNVYVADNFNQAIRKITSAGAVTTFAGGVWGAADGTGMEARFRYPYGVATDSVNNIYVADTNNNTIRKITSPGVVTTLAGTAGVFGSADGTGTAARFDRPYSVAADSAGNTYVADTYNHTIRKITVAGAVTTLAGTAGVMGSADGTGTAASFENPFGVATDGSGNVYVADYVNHTIRKITSSGVVATLAGTAGASGSTDGSGAAARFNFPYGIAADSAGNVYVADYGNHAIRKITSAGAVTTLAGTAGTPGSADGVGTLASFNHPAGVATDSTGNVYVADTGNHTIRKITSAGAVTTLAGAAGMPGSTDGVGTAAGFHFPSGVATDSASNVYVADANNHTLRKITPAGEVTTVVGVANQASFTPGALPGRLAYPLSVAVSGSSLYIALANGVAVVRNRP